MKQIIKAVSRDILCEEVASEKCVTDICWIYFYVGQTGASCNKIKHLRIADGCRN